MRHYLLVGAACLALFVSQTARADMTADDAEFLGTSQACNPKAGTYCLKSAPNPAATAATAVPPPANLSAQQQEGLKRVAALLAFRDQVCASQPADTVCQQLQALGDAQTNVQNPMALSAEKKLDYLLPLYARQCASYSASTACGTAWRSISAFAKAALSARGQSDPGSSGDSQATAGCRQIRGEPRPEYDLSGCPRPPALVEFKPFIGPPAPRATKSR